MTRIRSVNPPGSKNSSSSLVPTCLATRERWTFCIRRRSGGQFLDTLVGLRTDQAFSVQRVLSAYTDDKPFSLDLVGAVLRQSTFIDKMHDFGWTDPKFMDDPSNEIVFTHAIARYHA